VIELHYVHTPNARKVRIMLAETGFAFHRIDYDVRAGDHLVPAFRKLNPNNKLPVIRDLAPAASAEPVTVFESGAILIYLAEKAAQLLPASGTQRAITLEWLMWQMSALGPMGGQAVHFRRHAPTNEIYARQRYDNEVIRLLNVLEYRLTQAEYLAEDYSIADIACWPIVSAMPFFGFDLEEFVAINRWRGAIAARPAVQEAMDDSEIPDRLKANPAALTDDERSILYGERQAAAASYKAAAL
jgi:GST-like protein